MGEIAEMMLDGTMCEGCGEFLDGGNDGPGFPQYCSACRSDGRGYDDSDVPPKAKKKTSCPTCKKRVKEAGLVDHMRDVHGAR